MAVAFVVGLHAYIIKCASCLPSDVLQAFCLLGDCHRETGCGLPQIECVEPVCAVAYFFCFHVFLFFASSWRGGQFLAPPKDNRYYYLLLLLLYRCKLICDARVIFGIIATEVVEAITVDGSIH